MLLDGRVTNDPDAGWKGGRPKVHSSCQLFAPREPKDHKRTQIPPDEIWESLYKLRLRESEKLKTVLELYNVEIHQTKAGPDYHRLKTMVKRSIEQNLRMKNFQARNGNYETSAVVKNQMAKQREQRSLGDCWQWKANGQCPKGDTCSFRLDMNKRAKSAQPNPSPRSSK